MPRLFLIALLLVCSRLGHAAEVLDVRVWPLLDRSRVEIAIAGELDHRVFSVEGPDRLVVDIARATWAAGLPKPEVRTRELSGLRWATRDRENLRLVFDLAGPVRLETAVLGVRSEEGRGSWLVIEVLPSRSKALPWPARHASRQPEQPGAEPARLAVDPTPRRSRVDTSTALRAGPETSASGPSTAPRTGPDGIASGPSTASRPGPEGIASGPSTASRPGPEGIASGPSTASRPGPEGTASGPAVSSRPGPEGTASGPAVSSRPGPEGTASGPAVSSRPGPEGTASGPADTPRAGLAAARAASPPAPSPVAANRTQPRGRPVVIAIDAGHGGVDPGAAGRRGTREKDVTLAIARELASLVNREPGMRAVLIRDRDVFIPLRRRMQIARDRGADLFLSIHADAFHQSQVQGSSVYVLSGRGASSEQAKLLAERENAVDLLGGVSLDHPDPMVRSVILDLAQTGTLQASERVAQDLLQALSAVTNVHRKEVQHAGFAVLKSPDVPSVLVETAFISNPDEERRLADRRHQRILAKALLTGIRNYFGRHAPGGTLLAQRVAP